MVVDTMRAALALGYHQAQPMRLATAVMPAANGLIPRVDGVIPRIGSSITTEGITVVNYFESQGIATTAAAEAIARSRNKWRSLEIMQAAALPVPRTTLVGNQEELESAIDAVGGYPFLVKLNQGTHGRGVWLVSNLATAVAIFHILQRRSHLMLVQEFIHEADGKDLRLIIVGDRCVAAMERRAPAGEFRANLHRGGKAVALTPGRELLDIAIQAAHSHGLGVAGVDILQSTRGPLLLEVNSSPGLEGIEGATGQDVATSIIQYLERKVGYMHRSGYRKRRRKRKRT